MTAANFNPRRVVGVEPAFRAASGIQSQHPTMGLLIGGRTIASGV